MSSDDAPAEAAPPDVTTADVTTADQAQHGLLAELKAELGGALVGSHVAHADLWVRVTADAWRATAEACRRLGLDYFCYLSGIDWMPHTWPNPKVADEDGDAEDGEENGDSAAEAPEPVADPVAVADGWQTGVAGGDARFQVLARLYSTTRHIGVTLKADLDDSEPRVDSIHEVYAGADWHERETWEMYGFDFTGHPHLVHLYLPGEFEGFPLRKDFPLLSREVKPWPGLVDVEPFPPGTDSEPAPGDDVTSSGEAGDVTAAGEAG